MYPYHNRNQSLKVTTHKTLTYGCTHSQTCNLGLVGLGASTIKHSVQVTKILCAHNTSLFMFIVLSDTRQGCTCSIITRGVCNWLPYDFSGSFPFRIGPKNSKNSLVLLHKVLLLCLWHTCQDYIIFETILYVSWGHASTSEHLMQMPNSKQVFPSQETNNIELLYYSARPSDQLISKKLWGPYNLKTK